jgi:uncharacterized protein with HEPN domain
MRSDRFRLLDILDAIEVVAQYLPPDQTLFNRDPPLQSHILRHLMIIGEASYKLSGDIKTRFPQIPWKQIEGMRHILVHDYFKVDLDIVFNSARNDLPRMRSQVEMMLSTLPMESDEKGL